MGTVEGKETVIGEQLLLFQDQDMLLNRGILELVRLNLDAARSAFSRYEELYHDTDAIDRETKIIDFLTRDIWRLRLHKYPRTKSFFIKQLRVVVLAVRGYIEDKCKFRASALTFFSLLSFVPVLAMIFGIAKGFGIEERVKAVILEKMEGQEEVAEKIITFATSLLDFVSYHKWETSHTLQAATILVSPLVGQRGQESAQYGKSVSHVQVYHVKANLFH